MMNMGNIQNLMQQAQRMQNDLNKTQKELEKNRYEGTSSLVKVTLDGKKELCSINIDADELEKDDLELLEDMILAAFKDACKKVNEDREKKLGKFGKGLSNLL